MIHDLKIIAINHKILETGKIYWYVTECGECYAISYHKERIKNNYIKCHNCSQKLKPVKAFLKFRLPRKTKKKFFKILGLPDYNQKGYNYYKQDKLYLVKFKHLRKRKY